MCCIYPHFYVFIFDINRIIHHYYTYSLIKKKKCQKHRNVFMTEVFYSIKMIQTLNNKNLLLDWIHSFNQQSYLNLKIHRFTLFYQSILVEWHIFCFSY